MKTPSEVFTTPSSRKLGILNDLEYPLHDFNTRVYCCETVRIPGGGRKLKRVYIASALYGENIGFRENEEGLWEVSFMDYDIGVYDGETNQFTPLA